jgi:hypothetical protein
MPPYPFLVYFDATYPIATTALPYPSRDIETYAYVTFWYARSYLRNEH